MKPMLLMLVLVAFAAPALAQQAEKAAFFRNLSAQCGRTFTGASTFPDDPAHDFAGKVLTATLTSCTDTEIRMAFVVGEDRSRTWILRLSAEGLHFTHDHRDPDGTPHAITNYGGWATDAGSAYRQHFPADAATGALIPAAVTNVWTFLLDPEAGTLTYHLSRHGQPRYEAVLRADG